MRWSKAQQSGSQLDIILSCEVRHEACAEGEEHGFVLIGEGDRALVGRVDASDGAEQGGFTGAVWPYNADTLAVSDVERDVADSPEVVGMGGVLVQDAVYQALPGAFVSWKPDGEIGDGYHSCITLCAILLAAISQYFSSISIPMALRPKSLAALCLDVFES